MSHPHAGSRWPTALAVGAVTVPAVVVAHLLTAGSAPSAVALALVAVTVTVTALAVPGEGSMRLVAAVALGQLAGHLVLLIQLPASAGGGGCLPVMGRGAELGMRLAVLRADGACPPGSLALSAAVTAATAALLAAAVVVLGQVAVALLGAALVGAGERSWRGVAALVTALADLVVVLAGALLAAAHRLRAKVAVPLRRGRQVLVARSGIPAGRRAVAVHARRGPPLPA